MSEMRISPRERLVLTAIIELYIATGEPVASQAVAQTFANRDGLSSATIRNVMAQLARVESAGAAAYLRRPGADGRSVPLLRRTDRAPGPDAGRHAGRSGR